MHIWPAHLFNPKTVQARIVQRTISGGVSLSDEEDVILADGGGRWEITFSDIELRTPAQIRAWEAWNEYLAAGTVECMVPMLSLSTAPRPYLGKRPARPSALYSDDEVFPTVVQYAEPTIIAETGGSASLRATSLSISITRGDELKGGEKFGIDGRVYRIGQKVSGSIWKIAPPLRDPVSAGVAVEFDWPLLRCFSVAGEDFSPAVRLGRFSDGAQITFRERFT